MKGVIMKKKQIAILLGMTLCMMPLSSCSADAKTDTKQEETKETGEDQENREQMAQTVCLLRLGRK